jgi:hypothetical protein
VLEDWLVPAGSGVSAPTQLLRYIRWRRGGTRYELLTNVLAPTRLAADEALALYPFRWSVERMYFDLKTVLNLNRVYAANPNAVAMQVYAAGLVYNAMRMAQSEAAAKLGVVPEEISPAKFFPRVAVACYLYGLEQQWARDLYRRHPRTHFRLSRPDAGGHVSRWRPFTSNLGPTTAGTVDSAPRGVPESPSLMCAVATSSSGYLSGGVPKTSYVLPDGGAERRPTRARRRLRGRYSPASWTSTRPPCLSSHLRKIPRGESSSHLTCNPRRPSLGPA